MTKTGYDQFFKNARNAAEGKPASQKVSSQKTSAQPKFAFKARKKAKAKFPIMSLVFCFMGVCVAFVAYENYDKISTLLSKVEITLTSAGAEEVKKETKPATEEKAGEAKAFTKPVVAEPTGEELNHLMRLAERKKELDAREEELNRMETEMSKQKEELQTKVAELEKMRSAISSMLEERVKADDQKVETLVQFYSNMKPPQAAKVFETLDEDLAVQILGRMKKKNAAEVLNLMKPDKAQLFTEKFAGYKRSVASKTDDKSEVAPDSQQVPTKP